MTTHSIREEIDGVLAFIGCMWLVFAIGHILPFDIGSYGITPRTLRGLIGILTAPFLHGNLEHIVSNTIPLFFLLVLLAGSRPQSWAVVAYIMILGGALLWLFGRNATHIGASGLIFGLIAYLIVSGIRERRVGPMIISIIVGFVYGGTLAAGVVPSSSPYISWEGHLFGAIAGVIVAFWLTSNRQAHDEAQMFSE
jgi:membrane associated rhomboid family serine protease